MSFSVFNDSGVVQIDDRDSVMSLIEEGELTPEPEPDYLSVNNDRNEYPHVYSFYFQGPTIPSDAPFLFAVKVPEGVIVAPSSPDPMTDDIPFGTNEVAFLSYNPGPFQYRYFAPYSSKIYQGNDKWGMIVYKENGEVAYDSRIPEAAFVKYLNMTDFEHVWTIDESRDAWIVLNTWPIWMGLYGRPQGEPAVVSVYGITRFTPNEVHTASIGYEAPFALPSSASAAGPFTGGSSFLIDSVSLG